RPERRPVLALSPALRLESTLGRQVEILLRRAALGVFTRIKAREMLAEDLLRAPALEPLRAAVPAQHPPARVELDDGAIGDAFHHQPEAFLRPSQLGAGVIACVEAPQARFQNVANAR